MNKTEFIKLLEETKIPENCIDTTKYLQPIANALMSIIPTKLFRFRAINEYTLSAFDKDLIFCSRAKDFNDPYDSLLTAQSLEKLLSLDSDNLYSLMSAVRQFLVDGHEAPQNTTNLFPNDLWNKIVESLRLTTKNCSETNDKENLLFGITELQNRVREFEVGLRNSNSYACFSEVVTSQTMWGHYADYHKGFALSYDLVSILTDSTKGVFVMPVIYSSTRFDASNILASCLGKAMGVQVKRLDQLDMIKSALYKSPVWSYEKEWRLINTADMINPHPSIEYAPIEIYYGSQISEINKKILHSIAVEKGLKEFDMYIDRESYNYEMKIKSFSLNT